MILASYFRCTLARRLKISSEPDRTKTNLTFNHEIAYKIAKPHATFTIIQILMRHLR